MNGRNRLHPALSAVVETFSVSMIIFALGHIGWGGERVARYWLGRLDFNMILMKGMLGFLLFAGALHVGLDDLKKERGPVAVLSTLGVLISAILVAVGLRVAFVRLGHDVSWFRCLLFGALISPTDPVAVLPLVRHSKAPRSVVATAAAESLFNDGVSVVLFAALLGAAVDGGVSAQKAAVMFLKQAGGGIALGLACGWIGCLALRLVGWRPGKVGLTIALVAAAYTGGNWVHVSGLLAVAVAGIWVGNREAGVKEFWTWAEKVMNVVLFALLGLQALVIHWSRPAIAAGLAAVPIVLAARALSVGAPLAVMRLWRRFEPGTFKILVWGGLRGAIPLALAFTLPSGPEKALFLAATYLVSVFSLVVQGSTIES